ncbi:MAG: alanine--tRNA ligase [Candidatus Marinimicrobia bacterium]|jgi:alanyl-tRNA synthetase|nr:alanine--tRNA ligase [Candidatus Neomarinimicrobiota bacterium]MBT3497009.1 alanine--tRNA ligase [Candidatus Neomarinimicrobiota bacterium]MBT3692596.1 alanine--tRNA ligase [Candidatus Neomarinimicrobiota bacterium]MBT3732434.1 alanine--tRNA ligase [Candidatus Neomarinimicrobiota bacterium]MBT4144692.1 alanine--tRNA ligase [Candidatus Neomarinimicrobiota bacterium]
MNASEIRQSFITFFENKNHQFVRSSSVVPIDDPSLLFTNAGMNQFKPILLGEKEANPSRAVNSQKCIRVSGKHNDLEEVGVDAFHHTFFEMLGNWSFGDYYKEDAIRWAWEFFTEVLKLDKERLFASVYQEDDEAMDLWQKVTDISPDRILKFGKKANFWEMGETGPCGPCSEIHYYMGEDLSKIDASGVNNTDEYWELWNLVFIQYNRKKDGSLEDLPSKHVDTGAGLERIVSVMQGKRSNYETDLFMPIIEKIEKITSINASENLVPFQVIADHIRMLSFSIADGALPSNEGRGYVLRRILRRAARFGRILDQHEPFLYQLVDTLGKVMGDVFPEILEKQAHIEKVIQAEEKSFNATLDRGIQHFEKLVSQLSAKEIPGNEAFKLYDTYGFPLDLTELMARELDLNVDTKGFDEAMSQQRERAKSAGKFQSNKAFLEWEVISKGKDSHFIGYEHLEGKSHIRKKTELDGKLILVLDQTPFYAESGGQVGDKGIISGDCFELKVEDVKKEGDAFFHFCIGKIPESALESELSCKVDYTYRQSVRLNHSATHLLHSALKHVLGEHVQQAGSLVHTDYLRFDLTHFEKIQQKELIEIEKYVNDRIRNNNKVETILKAFDEAKKEGATALFGEKYGDEVRVVSMGKSSLELCGGTHVQRTGDIGLFKIVEESSLASGVRRIIALTGGTAFDFVQNMSEKLNQVQGQLNCAEDEINERLEKLFSDKKNLEKKLKNRSESGGGEVDELLAQAEKVNTYDLIIAKTTVGDMDEAKNLGDTLASKLKSGMAVLFFEGEKKPGAVILISQDLVAKGLNAGQMGKTIGGFMGGGGGGKPHLATAGGRDKKLVSEAMTKSKTLFEQTLKEIK